MAASSSLSEPASLQGAALHPSSLLGPSFSQAQDSSPSLGDEGVSQNRASPSPMAKPTCFCGWIQLTHHTPVMDQMRGWAPGCREGSDLRIQTLMYVVTR